MKAGFNNVMVVWNVEGVTLNCEAEKFLSCTIVKLGFVL
jgi:hypothetical protein